MMVQRVPPVVAMPAPEAALFTFTFLSYSGTGILITAIISGFLMGFSLPRMAKVYVETVGVVKYSLITISAMLALGTLTRYAGVDATLGSGLRRDPASSIPSSARCSAGSALRSPDRTPPRTCCSAVCSASPPNNSGSRRS